MIRIEGLCLKAGDFALKEICLSVEAGQYMVLMGPTGSGKTLLLKSICGLISPTAGSIHLDGQDVTNLEPRLRGIGYVPQDAGLFPHLSVERNIAFPLSVRGIRRRQARPRIGWLVDMLGLAPLLGRSVQRLSGGERQKVAVARALAAEPKLLLLDEPTSSLDGPTRDHLLGELVRLQRKLNIVTLHVCHNLQEATTVGKQAAVMYQGHLVQAGQLDELLTKPRTETVARFLGHESILTGQATPSKEGESVIDFAGAKLTVSGRHDGQVLFAARPESLRVRVDKSPGTDRVEAVLERIENRGMFHRAVLKLSHPGASGTIIVHVLSRELDQLPAIGQECTIEFPPGVVHVLSSDEE